MGKPPDLFKQQARVGNMTATSKASNEYKRPKPTLAQIYQNEKQDEQTAMIYAAPTEVSHVDPANRYSAHSALHITLASI